MTYSVWLDVKPYSTTAPKVYSSFLDLAVPSESLCVDLIKYYLEYSNQLLKYFSSQSVTGFTATEVK